MSYLKPEPFNVLAGKPINVEQPMEMDWWEEHRQQALRAKNRLQRNDSIELRDQIAEFLEDGPVTCQIFGAVFASDADMVQRCENRYRKHYGL